MDNDSSNGSSNGSSRITRHIPLAVTVVIMVLTYIQSHQVFTLPAVERAAEGAAEHCLAGIADLLSDPGGS